jgi:ankyrin repeat protein
MPKIARAKDVVVDLESSTVLALTLLEAVGNGDIEKMKVAIEGQINILLYTAACAEVSNSRITKKLLSKGADVSFVNRSGRNPLHVASAKGHETIVKMLLKYGADLYATDNDGRNALHAAIDHGESALASWLFKNMVDFKAGDEDLRPALFKAIRRGDTAMVRCLLKNGADINGTNEGFTVLSTAARTCNSEMVK